MKKISVLLLILATSMFVWGCKSNNHQKHMGRNPLNHRHQNQTYHNGLSDANCNHLSDKEVEFAKKLSKFHLQIFCKEFSEDQREKAIELYNDSKILKKRGKSTIVVPITADSAVEKVIRDSRDASSNDNTALKTN